MDSQLIIHDMKSLVGLFSSYGVKRLFLKVLAPNDNSKQQIYFGPNFNALGLFPTMGVESTPNGNNPIYKGPLNFWWIGADGQVSRAPHAKLILYPQYPEVRFSGFLLGSKFAPSHLLNETSGRPEGRLLFMGVHPDGRIFGLALPPEHPVGKEWVLFPGLAEAGVFTEVPIVGDSRTELLRNLCGIHHKEWIKSKMLWRGVITDCTSQHCGGYTLEAELGVSANGFSEPDFLGWEVKSFTSPSIEKPRSNVVTVITPEPTGGYYKAAGPEAFVRKYGYVDRMGREDRLNFGGIHSVGRRQALTGLTIELLGYDAESRKIQSDGGIALTAANGEQAAVWHFAELMTHWNRKHSRAAYVPAEMRKVPEQSYRYGRKVLLGEGSDFLLFLEAMSVGAVYYDPGIKLEGASTDSPKTKRRSQFRIKSKDLGSLYQKIGWVDVCE